MTRPILVRCDWCEGDGRIVIGEIDRRVLLGEGDRYECPYCEGRGSMLFDSEAVTFEDVLELDAELGSLE